MSFLGKILPTKNRGAGYEALKDKDYVSDKVINPAFTLATPSAKGLIQFMYKNYAGSSSDKILTLSFDNNTLNIKGTTVEVAHFLYNLSTTSSEPMEKLLKSDPILEDLISWYSTQLKIAPSPVLPR